MLASFRLPAFPNLQIEAPAPGTVKRHEQHIFLWSPQPAGRAATGEPDWPAKVERLPVLLNAFKAVSAAKLKQHIPGSIKITAYEEACPGDTAPPKPDHCHCLVFPQGVSFYNLPQNKLGRLIPALCSSMPELEAEDGSDTDLAHWKAGDADAAWDPPEMPQLDHQLAWMQGELKGLHLFVCAHGSRDARCGAIGNALVTRLSELVWQQQLDGQVHIHRCSHVGGHKYAGNVVVYGQLSPCDGDWFGGVNPENAADFLRNLVEMEVGSDGPLGNSFLMPLWRGRSGQSPSEQLEYAACACASAA
ncbi:hypothetical protein WJX84_000418 [Apatococcus fuscideae]|uniref:Sucrase n=1 Tax=Apatococcus fuscideae TaxID=2026836 RepID=A0AAW1TJ87_9CHLO